MDKENTERLEGEDDIEIPNLIKKVPLRQERTSGSMLKRVQ